MYFDLLNTNIIFIFLGQLLFWRYLPKTNFFNNEKSQFGSWPELFTLYTYLMLLYFICIVIMLTNILSHGFEKSIKKCEQCIKKKLKKIEKFSFFSNFFLFNALTFVEKKMSKILILNDTIVNFISFLMRYNTHLLRQF